MPDKSWKAYERRIARALGGRRTGILGGEDIEHPRLSIECKLLSDIPAWLARLWKQTTENCPDGKIPVAIVKRKGARDNEAWVIFRFGDMPKETDKGSNNARL